MPRCRKRDEQKIDPYRAQPLPLNRPVAVYYRQSSEGQIGNIVDIFKYLGMMLSFGFNKHRRSVAVQPLLPETGRDSFSSASFLSRTKSLG